MGESHLEGTGSRSLPVRLGRRRSDRTLEPRRALRWAATAVAVTALIAGCSTPPKPVLATVRIGSAHVEFHVELAQTADQ